MPRILTRHLRRFLADLGYYLYLRYSTRRSRFARARRTLGML